MNKVWECIIDVFIGLLIIFVSVFIYFGLRTEAVMKAMYGDITKDFISDVKKNGVITSDDYEKYTEMMGVGNGLFNISLEHRYKILEPEYRFKTLEEIIDDQNKAYKGSNEYHYRDVVTERPYVENPINDGNFNKDTNESILADAEDKPADSNHVHDENCYDGHRHTGSKEFIHEHAHSGACTEYISYIIINATCSVCKNAFDNGYVDYYWDTNTNSVIHNFTHWRNVCPNCGSTSYVNGNLIYYYQWSCGYDYDVSGLGIMGTTEHIPRNVVYQYIKSYPQENNGFITYTSGCYAYHTSKELKDSYTYYDFTNSLNLDSARRAFDTMLYRDNCQGYCYIPRYIRIGISSRYYYDKRELDDLPNIYYITYESYVDSNGDIRFRFKNYMWKQYGSDTPVYGYSNLGFPTNITVQELRYLYSSFNTIKGYFDNLLGRGRADQYNPSDLTTHLQWFSQRTRQFEYYGGTYYVIEDATEYINVCGFDHSLGVNTWVTICGHEEDYSLECDKLIVSITPTHSNQTVYINDPLITTAKAVYMNGSEKTVLCETDFSTSAICKDMTAILTYSYTIEGKTYSNTCEITVTVIPRNKNCPNGHVYNLNADGTDPGCPYCRAWVESLRIIRPTTTPIIITIGTTLQENNVTLLATYMDGHTEEVSDGYVDNLDTCYLGTKPVTIGYKGVSITVPVTTVCATMVCDICGYEYNLYPDGTNPGCPNCISKIPVFTGNIMEYEHINHTEEILEELYNSGRYSFNVNDVFSIKVSNKLSTTARQILRKIYPSITKRWFLIEKSEYIMTK